MATISHQTVRIAKGSHRSPEEGEVCVMELASMLAGEAFSDHPASVSPVLAAFLRGYNDTVDDDRRQLLIPWAAACVGTGPATNSDEDARRDLIVAAAGGPVSRLHASFCVRDGATIDESGSQRIGRLLGSRVARRRGDRRHAEASALVEQLVAVGARTGTELPHVERAVRERTTSHGSYEPTARRSDA